jgi:hypothetical protein
MRGQAMMKLCLRLKNNDINLKSFSALEFFGREGDWQTAVFAKEVGKIEVWEINPEFLPGLKRNLPSANLRIVNSYDYGVKTNDRFDFIVLDNPQAIFGPNDLYCEHFEALPIALNLLKSQGFVIFNINWAPFDFDAHPSWKERRSRFYGINDTSILSLENFLIPFYSEYFSKNGFHVLNSFVQSRNHEYLAYGVFHLKDTKINRK